MPFRRRFRRRSRSSKGTREWVNWETLQPTAPFYHRSFTLAPGASSTNWLISPSEAQDEYDEPTVVRFLIRRRIVAAYADFSAGPFELQFWNGIIVTRGVADASGNYDGIPAVVADAGNQDWLWWESHHFTSFFTTAGVAFRLGFYDANGNTDSSGGPYLGVIDVRAKRRIPQGHGLLYVNQAAPAVDNFGGSIVGYTCGRFLLLNH